MQPIHKLSILGGVLFTMAAACAALTPSEKTLIEGIFTAACPEEAAIPDIGAVVATWCPTEEAAVADALNGNPLPGTYLLLDPGDAGVPTARVLRTTSKGFIQIGHGRLRFNPVSLKADGGK